MTDEEIYLKYRDELIRYATVLVGPSDAEDVLSSVLTRIYRSRRSLGAIEAPRPYLMKAVLHESLNQRRHMGDQPLGEIAAEPARSEPEVLQAVISLPTRQRAATYLTYWCGMNSTEVGDLMGCRPATARRYVHFATRKLAGVLSNDT
ncbi:MAG: sigma-70 family RNA polymerase sigma factor [Acidimicrobiia bacterium]|nr:sigma-70 family RNA polymerase sigma factor [Acidimicrobiia bacterium]